MSEPKLRHVTCASPKGLHRIGYAEWGRRDAPLLLCVHGLTRNGRDFDALAERLADRYRVVCPDMLGRGTSDRAADPALYAVPQYIADCITLIARLDVEELTWLGTSMGGVIGMAVAAMPGNAVRRLILNDIGPEVGQVGIGRIGGDIGDDPTFASFEEGERELRGRMSEFGPHNDEQFRYLSRHYVVQRDGRWTFHYDPGIGAGFRAAAGQPAPSLWPFYEAIRCPVRVIRGASSDILSEQTALEMTRRGPKARVEVVPGVGHAPSLIPAEQIDLVERMLAD
ncbi:alpha/beta fold hydrolase [Quisquiliibacterium transsilvanicum]|uniref:Pimeloyl-ACP methyl ester carboxylesterase n=1 Tax=Quisquiliibacterium transsilvanicum TaxID=1549638 RepID=A0A7W8HEW5_9BURK|nr:pimeloyl-ACP methyl ester carboxylesterase [Quisquiliibacterium transsilvanicum]